ncbi:hypothetical protein [Leifsonia poae]|uniref:hypothetical protein n=1 Tax=Leifsonia poae TaxID=110933 RepID=UPI003D664FC9
MSFRHRLWQHLGTSAAVYGTIVYASLIAATGLHLHDTDPVLPVLTFCAVTIVVFWLAHIFAVALARHGDDEVTVDSPWASIKGAVDHSSGMLETSAIMSIPLVLGSLGILEPQASIRISLVVGVVTLAVLGYLAFTLRRREWWIRIVGTICTALFGVAIIVLEYSLH